VRSVRVEIQELVLDGFDRADEAGVRAAAARELERLVAADHGWPAARGDASRVGARTALTSASSSSAVGAEVARIVHGELGR
jgi:hypothetical protein